jgi:hypothetical protein
METRTIGELGAALLWLRNEYDYDKKDETRKKVVLERIDKILLSEDGINPWVTMKDMKNFRDKWRK